MKIYEIGTGYTPIPAQMGAATEIVVEELTRSFIKNGEDAQIIDIEARDRKPIELPIMEVKVPGMFTKTDVSLGIMHKLKRVVYSIKLARKLKSILKKTDEKVVFHFHNQYNMFFFLKLTSKKLRQKAVTAYTVHSYIWGTEWDEIESTVNKKYFQEVFCVKNSDLVFVLNDITIDHFVTKLGVNRDVIYKVINGVNVERYSALGDDEVASLKEQHGFSGKKLIFQVGSVCDRKNQFGSVKMLADYLKENKDIIYMYAGGIIDAEYHQSIINFAQQNGIAQQVKYVGELSPGEQLNQYYNMADCSVFTSNLESFGLVIIEAISSGTPVIIGSNLMFDLSSGYYMYHNAEEFVAQVDTVLSGKELTCGDGKEVVDKYNWDTVASMHSELFKNN
ncbi:MAG: glycosyltransferase family 4 protein [Clostridia bacterium]|nr:glycosyltransferase family 4 protein [Clostridia bacterium]